MAGTIHHGPPGSYKTSSAIWYEMLPSLRQGRIVITNIEGIKPVEEIEKEMDETFPATAEIWRISSQKEYGLELLRSFFHWAPIGAHIIFDEVQDIFPATGFKAEKYDYVHIDNYKGQIPDEWFNKHKELLDAIKPKDLTSADIDDLNQVIFDDNGHIIYPHDLKEAYMRHRKYNWDITVCTPSISQVHKLIRGSSEAAFSYASKDVIAKAIPYYKRRPRIKQHNALEAGTSYKKSDPTFFRKVPLDVHKLYKSTSTGQITKSGVGKSPLSSPIFIFASLCIVFGISYNIWAFIIRPSLDETPVQSPTSSSQESAKNPAKNNRQNTPVSDNTGNDKAPLESVGLDVYLALPNEPKRVYLTAANKIYESGEFKAVELHFEMVYDDGVIHIDSQQLQRFGVVASYVDYCLAKLSYEGQSERVYCKPNKPNQQPTQAARPVVEVF